MEVTRSLFHTARGYTESFCVYGEKMTIEWPQIEDEDEPVVFTAWASQPPAATRPAARPWRARGRPDRQDLLPPSIARFTVRGKYDDTNPQKSFETGGGHHGSHPHLVHEFVRSIVERRKPRVDEVTARRLDGARHLRSPVSSQGRRRGGDPLLRRAGLALARQRGDAGALCADYCTLRRVLH